MIWKINIMRFFARRMDYILVARNHKDNMGAVIFEAETPENLSAIIASGMENKPEIREVILKAAEIHLKKYEVDCRNFCKEVYNK